MNTKKILGVVAVLALVAVAMVGAGAADSATYYVSSSGDDNNAGTQDYPFKTLDKALSTMETAGATGTIVALSDLEDNGFRLGNAVTSDYNVTSLTLNLGSHNLTLGKSVGSAGTVTQGISVLSGYSLEITGSGDSKIIIGNYDASHANKSNVATMLMNYGTLSVNGVDLECSSANSFTRVSGNSDVGNVVIQVVSGELTLNDVNITARNDATGYTAIFVGNTSGSTYQSATPTVNLGDVTINGNVTVIGTDITDMATKEISGTTYYEPVKGNYTYTNQTYPYGANAVTFNVLASKTATLSTGSVFTIPTDVGVVNVPGTFEIAGTISGTTVKVLAGGVVTAEYKSLDLVSAGGLEIAATGELQVIDENVTIDQINAKVKAGTKAGAEISIINTTTGQAKTYEVQSDVTTTGKVAVQEVSQAKGTNVTLSVQSTYVFTVPESVVLSTSTTTPYIDPANVKVTSSLLVSGKKAVVKIASDAVDNDKINFELASGSDKAYYRLSPTGTSSYYQGANGTAGNNYIINAAFSGTKVNDVYELSQDIRFTTVDVASLIAGSYTGTLEFNFEMVDA